MAISQAMCTQFKRDVMLGVHDLDTNTVKIALYTSSASLGAATTAYTTSNEVASGNGYTTGGETLASASVVTNGTSGCFDSTDPSWTSATFTARGALIYNDSASGNEAIAVLDFGGDFTVAGGTFKIIFPAQTASNAIVRID